MIESAVDRNISFRLKGRGSCLNVNNVDVTNLFQSAGSSGENTDLALRLTRLENSLRLSPTEQSAPRQHRAIWAHLQRLENRLNSSNFGNATNINGGNINRRLRQLENRVNQLFTRLNYDNCTSNPCKNAGTCTNTFNGYTCKCTSAWEGVNCEVDVNECAIYAGTDLGCQNGADCENTPGGYK